MNDYYIWTSVVKIGTAILLLPMALFGGLSGFIAGGAAIAILLLSHMGDKMEHEKLKEEEAAKKQRLAETAKKNEALQKEFDRIYAEEAEIRAKYAQTMKEFHERKYGKGSADKYRVNFHKGEDEHGSADENAGDGTQ